MKIQDLLAAHTALRTRNCINLIPSENIMSPAAVQALSNDISGRYHTEWYGGTTYIQELLNLVKELACQLFNAEKAWITPLSGNMADLTALFAFSSPGDGVAALPFTNGGYPLDYSYFQRKHIPLAYSQDELTLDAEESCRILEKEEPPLVFLGASFIPFPHPVREISQCVHAYGGIVVYDASHPLGLIAGGQFEDPLRDGADILLGSTHKSFPGPQGGIILACDQFSEKIERVIGEDPLKGIVLVDNVHNGRIAALGITIEEMLLNGEKYAKQVIKNSHALAKALHEGDSNLLTRSDGRTTDSHQVILSSENFEGGRRMMDRLARYRIFGDAGMRFGTGEVTRKGYTEEDMLAIGILISEILQEKADSGLNQDFLVQIRELAETHPSVVL